MKCIECNGEGLLNEKLCPICQGFGKIGDEPEEVREAPVDEEQEVVTPVKKVKMFKRK